MKRAIIILMMLFITTTAHAKRYGNAEFVGSLNIPNSTSLPATCTTGDQYMDTDATSGQRHYLCESANTWKLQGAAGAGTGDFLADGTVPMTGDLTTNSSILNSTGTHTIGGTGNTNNENLTFDFESNSNFITIGTLSGANVFDFGVFTVRLPDLEQFLFGTGLDAGFTWQTVGNDNLQLGAKVGNAAYSGYVSLMEYADLGNANRSPLATSLYPILRGYSQDETKATPYWEIGHNNTDVVLASGEGDINLVPDGGTVGITGAITATSITAAANATPTLEFTDSDATDGDVSVQQVVNCTDTGSGTEDCDWTASQQIAGSMTPFITADADANITLNRAPDIAFNISSEPKKWIVSILDGNASVGAGSIINLGYATAALTVTNVKVETSSASYEITGDLKYADARIGLANAVVVNDFDTTSGVRDDSTITSATIASGKFVYLSFDAAPNASDTDDSLVITWDFDE